MKKIFSGEVYDVMPTSNGIIFSYHKDDLDDSVIVSYKMVSFDTGRMTDVARNVYLISKFGSGYKSVVPFCDNFVTAKSILLTGSKVFLVLSDGTAHLIDVDGTPIWTGSMTYRSYAPSDVVLYNNALWASYSECNSLIRYNLATMREELRIGGNNSPFDKPKSLFVEDNNVFVGNFGSQKLTPVNLDTYSVFDYQTFEEPIYQYINAGGNRFVVLQSGLYLI